MECLFATPSRPRPLMTISAVCGILDRNQESVLQLIEEGELLFAFNIAAAETRHRIPRILWESIDDFLAGRKREFSSEGEAWAHVAPLIFPEKEQITTRDVMRALNCSRQHAIDLIREKTFVLAPGSHCRRGPGGSPKIETASLAAWLKSRRML